MSQATLHSALRSHDAAIPDGLTDARGRPAGRRFNIYRNNVATALMDALETGFPVIRKLLGAENFRNIARDFQWQNPPDSPLMMHYGAGFPDYLAGMPQLARFPYLADVARLELALRHSYHAADHTPLPPETLAAIYPEALMAAHLGLAPSLRLVRSRWPIHGLWRFNTVPGAEKPVGRAESVLVLRPDFDPAPHLISPPDAAAVQALLDGQPLGTALDAAGPEYSPAPLLTLLISHGAITDLTLTKETRC